MARKKNNKGAQYAAQMAAATLQLISDNFRVFVTEVIGLTNSQFHNELDDTLSNQLNRKLAIALPRGFGKSTHVAVAYPLWEMAKNHDARILIVSNTAEISRTSLSAIKRHVEQNRKYQLWAKATDPKGKGVLPQMRPKHKREEHWSQDAITVARDDLMLKDPTVTAVGLFGSILSRRADVIIMDDIVTQENSTTEEQRQKIKEWVHTTLLPVLVPGGRILCLGNTWHMDDLMSNMLKDPQFDVRKRTPAIQHEATRQDLWEQWGNIHLDESLPPEERKAKAAEFYATNKVEMDIGVEVLWPQRFPYTDLYLKRIGNPYSFARMFQCDPSIRPNQKFTESEIEQALKRGKDLMLQDAPRKEYETDCTFSGLDLAIAQKDGDECALVSLDLVRYDGGEFKKGDIVIRNIERGSFLPNVVRKMVARHYYNLKPMAIRVENNGYQEMMARDLGDWGIPVTSYTTGKEKNDPDIGVHALSVLLSQGRLILPSSNKDARTVRLVTQLINEMRAYPDGHTGDSLMALWFAYSEIRDYTVQKFVVPGGSYMPPPQGPATEADADKELIVKQELSRSDQAAINILKAVQDSLKPYAPPKELDADLVAQMKEKMDKGEDPVKAYNQVWNEQYARHRRKFWRDDERRGFG